MIFSKDKRTLGEEYANIMMIDSEKGMLPSLNTRIAYLTAFSLYPFILESIKVKLRRNDFFDLYSNERNDDKHEDCNRKGQSISLSFLSSILSLLIDMFVDVLIPLHTSLFYLNGKYSDWTRRLLRLRFIYYPRRTPESIKANMLYKLFSVTLAIISIFKAIKRIKEFKERLSEIRIKKKMETIKRENNKKDDNKYAKAITNPSTMTAMTAAIINDDKCSLCLEKFKNKTMTRCSHFFCWNCIVTWLLSQKKEECPLCRTACHLSQIFLVYNV